MNDQLERLNTVDPKQSGKVRRQRARDAGCLCAVAKGAAQRELKPDLIFIPNSEPTITSGKVRVSALKATLPIPEGVQVKNVTFVRELGNWRAVLEVKEEACAS